MSAREGEIYHVVDRLMREHNYTKDQVVNLAISLLRQVLDSGNQLALVENNRIVTIIKIPTFDDPEWSEANA